MTPEEIQLNPVSDALVYWLKEIAYQLAVANERATPHRCESICPGYGYRCELQLDHFGEHFSHTWKCQWREPIPMPPSSLDTPPNTEEPIHDCCWHTSPEPVDDRCNGEAFSLNTSAYEFPPCIHMPMGGKVQCAVCYKMKGHS